MLTFISLVGVLLLAFSALAAIRELTRCQGPFVPTAPLLTLREALLIPMAGWVLLVGPTVVARIAA